VNSVTTGVGVERVAAMLAARRAELAHESLRAIRAAIPAYSAIDDPAILADVTEHVAENHDALRTSLVRGRPVTAEDLAFIRPHAALRARRGVPLADFLHAFRIGHRVIWDAIRRLADEDEDARTAALLAARVVWSSSTTRARTPRRPTSRPSSCCWPKATGYAATSWRTCSRAATPRRGHGSRLPGLPRSTPVGAACS
jgi:hypothetical protein